MPTTRRSREAEPVRITTAPPNPHDEMSARRRRYLISMSIRTICFIGAVVVGDNWVRWVLVLAAFVLPYVAVVMANSANPRIEGTDLRGPDQGYKELQ